MTKKQLITMTKDMPAVNLDRDSLLVLCVNSCEQTDSQRFGWTGGVAWSGVSAAGGYGNRSEEECLQELLPVH